MSFKNQKQAAPARRRRITGVVEFYPDTGMINPTKEQLQEYLGTEIERDLTYISTKEGEDPVSHEPISYNTFRLDIWGEVRGTINNQEIKFKDKLTFYLETRYNQTKDGRFRWTDFRSLIETIGHTSEDVLNSVNEKENMKSWFLYYKDAEGNRTAHPELLRKTKVGEIDLYNFLARACNIRTDKIEPSEPLVLENYDALLEGNTSEIAEVLNRYNTAEFPVGVRVLAFINSKGYQSYYTKYFNSLGDRNYKFLVKAADNEYSGIKGDYQDSVDLQYYEESQTHTDEAPEEEDAQTAEGNDLPF